MWSLFYLSINLKAMALSKIEKVSHYGVVVIATLAVVVSIWQVRISERQLEIQREHNRLTVKPDISISQTVSGDQSQMELTIVNKGFGPAKIKSLELNFKGKTYSSWIMLLNELGLTSNIRKVVDFSNNMVLAQGESDIILKLMNFPNEGLGVKAKINFTSIYEEEFTVEADL